jgi:hypothetical protein
MAKLVIRFSGLCMPAADPHPSGKVGVPCVHVLLPNFGTVDSPIPGPSHPVHHARVFYETMYSVAPHPGLDVVCESLALGTLDPLELAPAGTTLPGLTFDVAGAMRSIQEIAGGGAITSTLKRQYVDPSDTAPAGLQARVTLRAGQGTALLPAEPPMWTIASGTDKTLATAFDWVVTGLPEDTPLTFRIRALAGGRLRRSFSLKPQGGQIVLHVMNGALYDLPPAVHQPRRLRKALEEADHFMAYYALFPGSSGHPPRLSADHWNAEVPAGKVRTICKGHAEGTGGSLADRTPATDTCAECRTYVEPCTAPDCFES